MSKRIVVKLPSSLVVFLRMIEEIWGAGNVNFKPSKFPREPQRDKLGRQKVDKKTKRPLWKPSRFRVLYTYPLPTADGKRPRKTAEGTTKEVKDRLSYLLPDESLLTLDAIKRRRAGLVLMRERLVKGAEKLAKMETAFEAFLKVNPDHSLAEMESQLKKLYDSIEAAPAPDLTIDDSEDSDATDTESEFSFETSDDAEVDAPDAPDAPDAGHDGGDYPEQG